VNLFLKYSHVLSVLVLRIAKLSILRKPSRVYLVLALVFGLTFLVTSPPCGVPDEPAHLYRVFRVSQGTLFSSAEVKLPDLEGYCNLCNLVGFGQEPQNLTPQLKAFLTSSGGTLYEVGHSSSYAPIPYLPAAIIVKVLMPLKPNMAVYLYAARLVTFLAALAITYYAIRITPYGRWLFLVLALMPSRLFLMGSFSPDAITSAIALLWIAVVLAVLHKEKPISLSNFVLIFVIAVALALSKSMHCLLLLLALCLMFKQNSSKKMLVNLTLFFVCMMAIAGLALKFHPVGLDLSSAEAPFLNTQSAAGSGSNYFLAQVNASAQLKLLLENPLKIVSVLINGYGARGQNLIRGATGVFGQSNIYLSSWMYMIAYLLVASVFFLEKRRKLSLQYRSIATFVFMAAIIAIPLVMYLHWTPVGAKGFDGVLGRYYIPYLPLAFLAVGSRGRSLFKIRIARFIVVIGLSGLLLLSVSQVIGAYYLSPPAGGVVVIHAQADNTGVAWIAVKTKHGEKWRNKGVINFIPSAKRLVYECRVPAQQIKALRLILDTTGSMNVRIDSIEFRTLDGSLVKTVPWESIRQEGRVGKLEQANGDSPQSYIFMLSPENHSSHLSTEQLSVDLRKKR
jgi:uncharacterized membrane protein